MGVVTVKSAIITKAEANKLQAPLWLAGAAIHAAVAAVEVAATDSNNSIYRFCRVWSGWRLHRIDLFNDALTSGTDFNFGLWHVNDGAAADDNLFADAVTMATARTQPTDLLFYTLGIEKAEKRVWELLGLTEDPMIEYDLGCIAIAKGSGAGTLTLRVEWAQAV